MINQNKSIKLNVPFLLAAFAALFFYGCSSRQEVATEQPAAAADATLTIVKDKTPSQEQKEKLLKAKDALVEKLTGRLFDAMGQAGPAGAIDVCSKEARPLAESIGKANDVRIGRVGVRLRNEANKAPSWAQEFVDKKVAEPQFVVLSNQKPAAFLPIKLQATCTMCHGSKEQITPDVRSKLAELYPNDQATGFQEGDRRGWFWIESL